MLDKTYRVVIPAPPRAKQRARGTKAGIHYTPAPTENSEAWVRLCTVQQVGTPCLAGPVALRIGFYRLPPGSMPKAQRPDAAALRSHPTSKPDWDNLAKLAADALNGIAWRDDAVICRAEIVKHWSPPGCPPATVIEWRQLRPGELARDGLALYHGPRLCLSDAAAGLL